MRRTGTPTVVGKTAKESLEGPFRDWCREAFDALSGDDENLTLRRLRGRAVANWVRALLADMMASGALPPAKAVRTSRLVSLLVARAESNDVGALRFEEFLACVRVVTDPSPGSPVEEEIAWALLDVKREGVVPVELFPQARSLWAALGVFCTDEEAEQLTADAHEKDGGLLTAERFHELFSACAPGQPGRPNRGVPLLPLRDVGQDRVAITSGSARSVPAASARSGGERATSSRGGRLALRSTISSQARSARGPGGGNESEAEDARLPDMHFRRSPVRAKDHLLRSREIAEMSLFPALDGLEQHRDLEPSHSSARKHPGERGRKEAMYGAAGPPGAADGAASSTASNNQAPRKPPRRPIDWEMQEACWNRRQARMHPFQRVKVEYVGPEGKKVKGIGTLVKGWYHENTMVQVPHSRPPESKRPKEPPPEPPPWLSEAAKLRDGDKYVLVLVNAVEKVLPREWVTPIT